MKVQVINTEHNEIIGDIPAFMFCMASNTMQAFSLPILRQKFM